MRRRKFKWIIIITAIALAVIFCIAAVVNILKPKPAALTETVEEQETEESSEYILDTEEKSRHEAMDNPDNAEDTASLQKLQKLLLDINKQTEKYMENEK